MPHRYRPIATPPCSKRMRRGPLTLAVAAATLLGSGGADAATYTWDGGGNDSNWSTGQNWVGDSAPTSQDDDLVFAGTSGLTTTRDYPLGGAAGIGSITFAADAGAFVIDYATYDGAPIYRNITNLSANRQTITLIQLGLEQASHILDGGSGGLSIPSAEIILGTNTQLTIDGSGNSSLGGVIKELDNVFPGVLIKNGSGTLTLSGTNSYTGTTTVNAGTLVVNGSISSSASTVNNGGTLGGSGTVGSVTVASGGTVAPGNSIGTLNASSIDFSAGGTYQVEVDDAGNSDLLNVSGTATLTGGTVQVIPGAGNYNYSTDYTILSAGTINGTFGSVSSSLAFLDPTLSYDTNNVYLNLTRNDVSYSDVAGTKNQRAVGNALNTIVMNGSSGNMQSLINTINTLTTSGARQAYDSLSGVQHADAQSLLLGANGRFSNLLGARSHALAVHPGVATNQAAAFTPIQLAYNGDLSDLQLASNGTTAGLMENSGSGFWLTPQGGAGSIDDTENASGADYTWYGLYGGADKWLDNHRLVGFALGVSHTDANQAAGDINLDSMELAAYSRWQDDKRYLDASLTAGRHRTDSARRVSVGSLTRTASADYDAQSVGLSVEAGQTVFEQHEQRITPFLGLRYARLSRDGLTETGAGSANLVVDSDTQESLQGRIGVRTEQRSKSDSGRKLDWDLSVAWARELKDTASTLNAGFEGAPSTTFSIDGPQLDRNRIQVGIGLTTDIGKAMTFRIGYNGELAGSDQSHSASANFRMSW